jgi:ERCC4-type nuclease
VSRVLTVGLPFGDYWASIEDKKGNELSEVPIMFERKTIADLYSTLTNEDNIERHKEKIRKAEEMDCKLFLIVEGTLSDVEQGVPYSQTEPQKLVRTVFTFMVKYGFIPIFCNDDKEMVRFMLYTWEAFGRNFKKGKQ